MKMVNVEITEILQRTVSIPVDETLDENEAVKKAREMYFNEKFVLDYSDFVDVSFGTI